jgi:hypothetical protein
LEASNPRLALISSLTLGVAVAVSAIQAAFGKRSVPRYFKWVILDLLIAGMIFRFSL